MSRYHGRSTDTIEQRSVKLRSHLGAKCRGSSLNNLDSASPRGNRGRRRSGARLRRSRRRSTTDAYRGNLRANPWLYNRALQSVAGRTRRLRSLVERVEKPTDSRPARLLCSLAADADSLGDRPVVGPGASPTPLPRWGQCCFDGSPNPVLSVSGADRTRRNTPSREETSRGTSSPLRTARTKSYARPIGHSAFRGPKSGRQYEYCGG